MGPTHALHGHWPSLVTMLIIFTFYMQWLVLLQGKEENLIQGEIAGWLYGKDCRDADGGITTET